MQAVIFKPVGFATVPEVAYVEAGSSVDLVCQRLAGVAHRRYEYDPRHLLGLIRDVLPHGAQEVNPWGYPPDVTALWVINYRIGMKKDGAHLLPIYLFTITEHEVHLGTVGAERVATPIHQAKGGYTLECIGSEEPERTGEYGSCLPPKDLPF